MKIFINELFLISGEDWIPGDSQAIEDNIYALFKSLNCFNYHVEPIVYYSGAGLASLIDNFELLDSISDYSLTNPIAQLRTLLEEIEAIDWNFEKKQRDDHCYYLMLGGGAINHYINRTTIAEATEFGFLGADVAIINFISSEFNQSNPIFITRSKIPPPPNIQTFGFSVLTTKSTILDFVRANRKNRIYNWNQKHGEYGKGMISNKKEDVSPLEGSREEAEALLNLAIGSRKTDELYAYDKSKHKFMVFKDEYTAVNSYHSYHPINQNEIAADIQKFLLEE